MFARVVDIFLRVYGHYLGYHPGKWRIMVALYPFARPSWTAKRIVERFGCLFECDLHDYEQREIYYAGLEPHQTSHLKKLIKRGWTVFDIGANCGYYSLLTSKWVGDSGQVHAFEPSPRNLTTLQRNVQLNNCPNLIVHAAALGDVEGFCDIEQGEPGDCSQDRIRTGSSVQMTTLDSFVQRNSIRYIDFVKVDIEGSECRFLRGAAETMRKSHPLMLIEINPAALARFGSTEEELEKRLDELGYHLFDFHWRGIRSYRRPTGRGWYRTVLALPHH